MNATINGVHLHYEVHGAGKPLLLIHGFPLSGWMWAGMVKSITQSGARVKIIVPDLRGHGRSDVTAETSMSQLADDIVGVLDAANERHPATVMGHSMGGYIALEMYRRHPGRVRALVLTNTKAAADTPEAARAREQAAIKVQREGSMVIAESMLAKLFAPEGHESTKEIWKQRIADAAPAGVAAALRAMATRRDSTDLLPKICVPTLVIAGEHDTVMPAHETRKMQQAIPGSRLEIIPHSAHMSAVEQPDRVADAVAGFMRSLV